MDIKGIVQRGENTYRFTVSCGFDGDGKHIRKTMTYKVPEGTAPSKAKKMVVGAYKDFEDRFALVETKLPALEMVRRATMNKIGRFTKQDIRELCPSLSISSIEGALRKMVASEELKREGNGKNICYFRLK